MRIPMNSLVRRISSICTLATLLVSGAASQQGIVHGRITDERNQPLRGNQLSDMNPQIVRTFRSSLPNALLLYSMPDHKSLRVMNRASTSPPTVTQLQEVVDNTNPLLLSAGYPALNQSHTHSLAVRYSETSPLAGRSMFLFLSATMTKGYVANATMIPSRDSVLLGGVSLSPGMQLTSPVNMNRYWNVCSFFTSGFPFSLISSTLNLNAGVTYTRTPGLVNSYENISNAWSLNEGFVVGSNISEDSDFTMTYMGNYTLARNTLQANANSYSYSHTLSLKWVWTSWEGIVLRNELNNNYTPGQAPGYNQNVIVWNISLGKKLFSDQRGQVKVGVADLLAQKSTVSRTVTETYLEDMRNEALTRYFIAGFTYTVR
jgi:hypothetical protein